MEALAETGRVPTVRCTRYHLLTNALAPTTPIRENGARPACWSMALASRSRGALWPSFALALMAADHRRSGNVQVGVDCSREATGNHRGSLRTCEYAADVQQTRRRLGKLLGDKCRCLSMSDRLLHHGEVLKRSPCSWSTKGLNVNAQLAAL